MKLNISLTLPHNMVNFGSLTAEIDWRVCGIPANFNRFRFLASLLLLRPSPEVNQTLHDAWPSPGLVFLGLWPPNGILHVRCKIHFGLSLTFFYIGSVTARHSSSGREPSFAAWYKEWNYGTFIQSATYIRQGGHHVGHRPTFYSLFYVQCYGR